MPASSELSEREIEILRLVATGASNKEIASLLTISTNTVKVHLRNIFAKIEVTSRTEATLYALKNGLVEQIPASETMESPKLEEAEPALAEPQPIEMVAVPTTTRRSISSLLFVLAAGLVFLAALYWGISGRPAAPAPTPTNPPRWKSLNPMPTPRLGLALAPYEEGIFAIGGEAAQGVTGVVERFDPAQNRWETRAEKPTPVRDVQAAVIGGKIYLPGGKLESGHPTDQLEIYDPRQNQWSVGKRLPQALSGYALAAFEGRLYLFGGWDGENVLNTVWEYDPSLDSWQEKSKMPTARMFAGAAEANRHLYVLGGSDGQHALDVNEVYRPDQDQPGQNPWAKSTPLLAPRYAMGVVAVADLLHVVGGHNEAGNALPSLQFQPQQGVWREFERPSAQEWMYPGAAALGPQIYLLGGQVADNPSGDGRSYQAIYTVVFPIIE